MIAVQPRVYGAPPDLPRGWCPVRIKPWHVRYGMGYNHWHHENSGRILPSGDPAVCRRIAPGDETPLYLTPEIETWILQRLFEVSFRTRYNLTFRQVDVICRNAYRHLTSGKVAFCDGSGNETNQSVVLNQNIGAGLMRWGYAVPNGNMMMAVNGPVTVAGKSCIPLLALDLSDPKMLNATIANSPYTIGWAVNSVVVANDVLEDCTPFPVMANNLAVGTPFFAFTTTRLNGVPVIYIETDWIEYLPKYTRQRVNPYFRNSYEGIDWL